ncbi:MAG: hypothetical protein HW385_1636, partial [candidate division NC10 bacterium]|nr:hypothetical protein [candidate division NC10 bacterium]
MPQRGGLSPADAADRRGHPPSQGFPKSADIQHGPPVLNPQAADGPHRSEEVIRMLDPIKTVVNPYNDRPPD